MQYIAYAQRGDFDEVRRGILRLRDVRRVLRPGARRASPIPQVAMLARRLNGKYLAPKSQHLEDRVQEIRNGDFNELIEKLMGKPVSELQELYNHRDIEKVRRNRDDVHRRNAGIHQEGGGNRAQTPRSSPEA
ncbi:MAG: hypothetical protein ACLU9S_12195 [Oscillospiraceae bacterium]